MALLRRKRGVGVRALRGPSGQASSAMRARSLWSEATSLEFLSFTLHCLQNSHVLIRINTNMGLKEVGELRKKG